MTRRTRTGAFYVVFAIASGAVVSCDDLPDFELGTCGNSVVDRDKGEECDRFAGKCATEDGEAIDCACALPGDVHECQYLEDDDGVADCPTGFFAGQDGVCRRPSGRFQASTIGIVPVVGVDGETADLDGDGTRDLVVTTPLDGSEAPSVTYFQRGGGYLGPYAFPVPPAVGRLTDDDLGATPDLDSIDDVVLPLGPALVTLRGAPGPTFLPKAYTPFRLDETPLPLPAGTTVRLFAHAKPGIFDVPYAVAEIPKIGTTPARLIFSLIDAGGFAPQPPNLTLVAALLDEGPEDLMAIDLIPDLPGEEIVAATADGIIVAAPHEVASDPPELVISLPLPNVIGLYRVVGEPTPTIGVMTSDGATPPDRSFRILRAFPSSSIPPAFESPLDVPDDDGDEVLAVGDIDQDGRIDAVTSSAVILGVFDAATKVGSPTTGNWTLARIVDLTGDGRLSVVALPNSDVDVLLPGSDFALNPALLSVGGVTVDTLAIADFDGDSVNDVLVATEPEKMTDGCEDTDDLFLSFGRSMGRPEEPVNVGQLRGVRRFTPARLEAPTLLDAVYDVGVQTGCAPATSEAGASAGLLLGATSRAIYSPFLPFLGPSDTTRRQILRVAVGELGRTPAEKDGDPDHTDVAVLFTKVPEEGKKLATYFVARMATGGDAEFVPITGSQAMMGLTAARELALGTVDPEEVPRHVPALEIADLFPDNAGGEVLAWVAAREGVRLSVTGLVADEPSSLVEWSQAISVEERKTAGKLRVLDVDADGSLDVVAFLFVDDETEPLYAWWFRNTGGDLALGGPLQIDTGAGVETPSDVASIIAPGCFENGLVESPCDVIPNAVFAHSTFVTSCPISVAASPTPSCSHVVVPSPRDADALGSDRILATLVDDVDLDGLEDLLVFRANGVFVHRQCSMSEVYAKQCEDTASDSSD